MKATFINPDTGRIRAGWRILICLLLMALISAVLMVGIRTILGSLRKDSTLQWSLVALSSTLTVLIARKYLDKKSMVSLGLRWDKYAILDILSGVLNSAVLMAGVFFLMLWTGLIEFKGFTFWQDPEALGTVIQTSAWLIAGAVAYKLAIVAWWEELFLEATLFKTWLKGPI
ncbi:MAG: hypothetical protein O3B41_07175 [Bacteroidetes bacterium]|nr:hypothetical protein [Bacteroidota bacterium]